ncbi:sugar transferase [Paraeggerthella sp. Marseille-Q4926]|uniref:sugar transferase n=1 Tax=Paraeggerthella sp. Marseille-Q4926 TaxID=2866587 RepID=UPI001CE3ED94|nr:sugar transferase [Paraeggerthella sp. Marseille-Q4926]
MEEKGQPISRSVDAEELVAEGSCLVSLIAADAVPEDEVEVQVGSREFAEACRSLDHRSFGYKVTKRVFDILFSGVVVVVGFLPCALLSIAIAVDTKGSPIYTQTRIGKNGKTFRIKKFRTMVVDSDDVEKYFSEDQLKLWKRERKVDNDPRITPLGQLIRAASLDELPQFIDVLFGHISIIGPRAITVDELNQHFTLDERKMLLSVAPGITGWWQVTDRNRATWMGGSRQMLELFYVQNASLSLDARVFFRTFKAMRRGQ